MSSHQQHHTESSQDQYTIGVLTISDSVFNGSSEDKSGPAALENISKCFAEQQARVTRQQVVPDSVDQIRAVVKTWSDEDHLALIITSGGTGFSQRDVTPEAIRPLIEREATGLEFAMHQESLQKTPFAMLARPLAGIRGTSIIICVPGSPKAVNEILARVLPVIPHAIALLRGTGGCGCANKDCPHRRSVVTQPATATTQHVCPHHGEASHQPKHERPWARQSYYAMVEMNDALRIVAQETPSSLGTAQLPLLECIGLVAAEDILAPFDFPPFPASVKDGYAVNSSDAFPGEYPVAEKSIMAGPSSEQHLELAKGTVAKVMTGAPLPRGADAVVQVEDTQEVDSNKVRILKQVQPGTDVRPIGSDIRKGEVLVQKGKKLGAAEIGLLASMGLATISVHRKPRVGILSTGDELVDLQSSKKSANLEYGQIYDSNRPTLVSALKQSLGGSVEIVDLGVATDATNDLKEQVLLNALQKNKVDVLITTGGVSMGELDLMKPLLESNGKVHFGRVRMKPGKPTTFATVESDQSGHRQLVFALPGNPVSALVCFYLFALPALRKMLGMQDFTLPRIEVKLQQPLQLDRERWEYHRARATYSFEDHCFVAQSTGSQASSRLLSLVASNVLLELRSGEGRIAAGELVPAFVIGELA